MSVPARFTDAYRDHRGAVTAVARRVCGSVHAIDVTQDVFVTLWSAPEKFDPNRGSLRSYLLVLAHHKAVDALRRETARKGRELRVDAEDVPAPMKVEDRLLRDEVGARVRTALAGLPASEREAIVCAYYEHRSYRATARWLEVPEGTIKSRIRSGLQRLHPLLGELEVDAGGAAAPLATSDDASSGAPVRPVAPAPEPAL